MERTSDWAMGPKSSHLEDEENHFNLHCSCGQVLKEHGQQSRAPEPAVSGPPAPPGVDPGTGRVATVGSAGDGDRPSD